MALDFDLAQTFYADSTAVEGASVVSITSIELYFQSKPVVGKTQSGLNKPGVSVYIASVSQDNTPILGGENTEYSSYVPYDSILTSETGVTATKFTFSKPVTISTDQVWAFVVKIDGSDNGYNLWCNKAGQKKLGTSEITSVSQGKIDGFFYKITNGSVLTPMRNMDLTFKVNIAKYTSTTATIKFVNRPVETVSTTGIVGVFRGGEDVYQQRSAHATGTVKVVAGNTVVIGSGTSFSSTLAPNTVFVITGGTPGNTDVRTVATIANNTYMTLTVAPSFSNTTAEYYKTVTGKLQQADVAFDKVILQDVTTNSTIYLTTGSTLYGVDSLASANISSIDAYQVNSVSPSFYYYAPREATLSTVTMSVANSSYAIDSSKDISVDLGTTYTLDAYPAVIASATTEKTSGTPFNSVSGTLTLSTSNPYVSPTLKNDGMSFYVEKFNLNNSTTNEYIPGLGQANSRYISQIVSLADGQLSEDLKVYTRVFRPKNTDIAVFARFKSPSDGVDVMNKRYWTQLSAANTGSLYSNPQNKSDYLELQYDVPFFNSGTTLTGTFTSSSACTVVTGTSGAVNNSSTGVVSGDVVRLYSASIANTYLIDTVVSSNSTTMTLSQPISNSSLIQSGLLVDKITNKYGAFLDVQNKNLLTYFNTSGGRMVGYDSYQVKIVLLSSDNVLVPYVDDVRAIAVTA